MKGNKTESKLLEDLQNLIIEKKELERISWDNLGKLIDYTGVGLKKAFLKKSLSKVHIEKIIFKLDLVEEAKDIGLNLSSERHSSLEKRNEQTQLRNLLKDDIFFKKDEDIELLKELCFKNWSALMEKDDFKDKVKLSSMKDIDKILDERLAIILKNMKE